MANLLNGQVKVAAKTVHVQANYIEKNPADRGRENKIMKKIITILMGIIFCGGCNTTQILKSEKKCGEFIGLNECVMAKKCMPMPGWKANNTGDYDETLLCVKKRPYTIADIERKLNQ